MITGFNTDVEHNGVVYHVQTEDKGLETPLILSLVYSGGAILASKRARYEDLIASGYSDEALSERLSRQHKLICAAIHAGRLEDLKKMSTATSGAAPASAPPETPEAAEEPQTETLSGEQEFKAAAEEPQLEILRGEQEFEALEEQRLAYVAEKQRLEASAEQEAAAESADLTIEEKLIPEPPPIQSGREVYTVHDQRRESVMGNFSLPAEGLHITLLGRHEFRSGENPTVKVLVGYRTGSQEQPIAKAAVSIKVLGTTFRPQLYSAKTQSDGVAAIATKIPTFSSGRAAILIRAVFEGKETELRRVILPSP